MLLPVMRRLLRTVLAVLAAATGLLAGLGGSTASAATNVRFGIADQHTAMFSDERWQALNLKITRYNVPWNAARPSERDTLDRALAYVNAARAAGVEPLLHITGRMPDGVVEPLPTRAAYRREVRKLVAIFRPLGVNTWGAWNEANHNSQPTQSHPERAAQYFLELRAACQGCTIVALDVLTQGSPRSTGVNSYRGYAERFYRALGRKGFLARIVGIHNYGELNRAAGPTFSLDLSRFVRRLAPATRFWITESGGTASLHRRPCDLKLQALGTRRMFRQAAALRKAGAGVDRLYMYNWTAADCGMQFDSGLIRPDGTARAALKDIQAGAVGFAR